MEAEDWTEHGTNESMDQIARGPVRAWKKDGGQGTGWSVDKIDGAWTREMAHGPPRWSMSQTDEA